MESKTKHIILLAVLMLILGITPKIQAQCSNVLTATVLSPLPNGTGYNVFVFPQIVAGADGSVSCTNLNLPIAVLHNGTNVYQLVYEVPGVRAVYEYSVTTPPESLAETLIFEYTNGISITNEFIVPPYFLVQPTSQSLFVGTNASFIAQAIHCTGYQWQKDGTNLTDDAHFFGTTNATLTISNLTQNDAGIYTVIAQHPSQPVTSANAVLNVFKPIKLSLTPIAAPSFVRLSARNADGSPFESSRSTNVSFYSTSDVSLSFSNWVLMTNSFVLKNGNLQVVLPIASGSNQFWRAVEQP